MRTLAQIVSWSVLLVGIVAPPFLYLAGRLGHDSLNVVMLTATVAWFVTAPFWMNREPGK